MPGMKKTLRRRRCPICDKLFKPNKFNPRQVVCSDASCQKIRQHENQREWERNNRSVHNEESRIRQQSYRKRKRSELKVPAQGASNPPKLRKLAPPQTPVNGYGSQLEAEMSELRKLANLQAAVLYGLIAQLINAQSDDDLENCTRSLQNISAHFSYGLNCINPNLESSDECVVNSIAKSKMRASPVQLAGSPVGS